MEHHGVILSKGFADACSPANSSNPAMDLDHVRDGRPTALLISDRRGAQEALIDAAGARLLGRVAVAEATARIDDLAQVDLVMVEADMPGLALAPLFDRLNRMAQERDTVLIIACGMACIDQAFGVFTADAVQLLCEADALDVATALALALRRREARARLWDRGRENEAARIDRLSTEVGRLARIVDALVGMDGGRTYPHDSGQTPCIADRGSRYTSEADTPVGFARAASSLQPNHIRDLLRVRRQRDQFLPADLFADPAWDMMLDLMVARLTDEQVSVSSLCIAAAVPPTTALRWIRQLTDRGLFLRQADPDDGRRIFIALSDEAADAITRWFAASRVLLRNSFE